MIRLASNFFASFAPSLRPLRLKVPLNFTLRGLLVFFLVVASYSVYAQKTDSTTTWKVTVGDSAKKDSLAYLKSPKQEHPPKKAAILSACIPGAGQIYNGNWWKAPIIWAGFGGLGYAFAWNNHQRSIYNTALHNRFDGDTATVDLLYPRYSTGDLTTLKDYYQRYRDLSAIGMVVLYTLNIVDATVDAHLWHFNQKMGDDLSLHLSPIAYPTAQGFYPGVSATFTFH